VDGDLTAFENLLIFSKLFHVERNIRKARIREALEYMDLSDRRNDLVKHFSGGMMRRLEIAQSLVNRPKVLFLDEPSIGLDPNSKKQGWNYIKNLNREFGVTIFITTHDMQEADELCDRIAIMNRGNIAILGSPSDLKASVGGDMITVKIASESPRAQLPKELGTIVSADEDQIKIHPVEPAEHALPRVMEFFSRASIPIDSISISKPNLEDVFAKYTKTTLSETEASEIYSEARVTRRSFQRHAS
jgi:ABC-2 type transport system ATP-binding protein